MNIQAENHGKLALISVSDKTGIEDFARELDQFGYRLLSTGGTASLLAQSGLKVTEVADHTGFPEIMAGRVKTLHPRIHGGLLGRANADEAVMQEHDIPRISLAVINLYPFEKVTSRPDCTLEEAIENIDIGGPAMVRSAAKNHASVGIVTSPDQYPAVLENLEQNGGDLSDSFRFELSVQAFNRIARYDAAISNYLSAIPVDHTEGPPQLTEFPTQANGCFGKIMDLRYGENPHQGAAWYRDLDDQSSGLTSARQLQGKALSFNNIADADAAWTCVQAFDMPACVIVKHANPCGVAVSSDLLTAYRKAFATDPTSAFGGIIAFNGELDAATAGAIIEQQFVEVIIARRVGEKARTVLNNKQNARVLEISGSASRPQTDIKRVSGGILVQSADNAVVDRKDCRVVSRRQPGKDQWRDMLFAWRVVKMVKSNAIVYVADGQTRGIGAGQMSRVDSARIARWKAEEAKLRLDGSVMASDAFFPFRDGIDAAASAGISCVIQPGGSMRDDEVIAAADEHDMAMVLTGVRHFRH